MIWRRVMLALPTVESVPSHVLDRVGRLVRGLQAELEVFHCLYEPQLAPLRGRAAALDASLIASRVKASKRRVERVADTLRDQNVEVRVTVRFDYPIFEAVVRQVLRHDPHLLIVPGAHGARGALSYTDARLIEACPCPLLLTKTERVYSQGPIVAAIDPMHIGGKPVELDDSIIAAAQTLSHALADAPVHVYHAVGPLPEAAAGEAGGSVTEPAAGAERHSASFTECQAEARKVAARHEVPESLVRVEAGVVESSLPAYVRRVRADAVVMGAVSRSYPARALFGYTAEKVLDALDCDVLIVKPRGFRCPVSRRPRTIKR
jgi:universal stress protein E